MRFADDLIWVVRDRKEFGSTMRFEAEQPEKLNCQWLRWESKFGNWWLDIIDILKFEPLLTHPRGDVKYVAGSMNLNLKKEVHTTEIRVISL